MVLSTYYPTFRIKYDILVKSIPERKEEHICLSNSEPQQSNNAMPGESVEERMAFEVFVFFYAVKDSAF